MARNLNNGNTAWPYGDIRDCVAILEESRQPYIIAKYPMRARFVDTPPVQVYELILFQTCDNGVVSLEMDRNAFSDIRDRHGLTLRHKERWGEVWAKDDRLRDLHRSMAIVRKRWMMKQYEAERDVRRLNGADEVPLRRAAQKRLAQAKRDVVKAEQDFITKHNITIFNF